MMKLRGKVALITGASRGIGREIADVFAANGASIIVNYHQSRQEAIATVNEIARTYKISSIAVQADVSNKVQVDALIQKAFGEYGKIDILVNNAGITRRGSLAEITEEDWDRVIDVNLKGTFLCSQAVAPIMQKQNEGTIINISSMRGVAGSERSMNYAVSKAGILVLTKCLAIELAPNIRVNAIAPGYIHTSIHEDKNHSRIKEIESTIPLKRFGKTKDIALTALFLASEGANYITGETIIVSGGKVMG